MSEMKAANYALLAEARSRSWAVTPQFWQPFAGLLAADSLTLQVPEAKANGKPKSQGVAVLGMRGLITPRPSILSMLFGGGGGLQELRENFRGAMASDEVGSIVFDIDSPGGSTDLVEETAAEIRAARGEKPIVAMVNTMAGSAAYWLAAQADEIVVTPSGHLGSIGVFGIHVDESGLHEKLGVKPTIISAGKYKVEGNSTEPLSDEGLEYQQSVIDEHYARFVNAVASGRGVTTKTVKNGYGEGRMVTAGKAVAEGMADRVDSFENVVGGLLSTQRSNSDRIARHSASVSPTVPLAVEDERDEDRSGKSPSQDAIAADQALADEVIASIAH